MSDYTIQSLSYSISVSNAEHQRIVSDALFQVLSYLIVFCLLYVVVY